MTEAVQPAPQDHKESYGRPIPGLTRGVALISLAGFTLSRLCLLSAFGIVIVSVFGRYFLGRAPLWSDDMVGFLLVGTVVFAAAEVLRRGEHLKVDIFSDMAGPRLRFVIDLASEALILTLCILVIREGFKASAFSRLIGDTIGGFLEWPADRLLLLLPAGAALLGLVAAERLLRLLFGLTTGTGERT